MPTNEHDGVDDVTDEQQALVLEDSELRVANGRTPPGNDDVERRTSDEATPPVDVADNA